MTILIAGGTGLIGKQLTEMLNEKGHTIHILTRRAKGHKGQVKYFKWIIGESIDEKAFYDAENGQLVDVIINLTGAGIADKRWTNSRKKEIMDSRVKPAAFLQSTLIALNLNIPVYISASGANYYANSESKFYSESDAAGGGFVQKVCEKWENQAQRMNNCMKRIVIMRTGVVLARQNSFLQKFTVTTQLFVAGVFGSGQQFLSWIHIEDLCEFYICAIENSHIEGAYNVAISEGETHQSFLKAYRKTTGKQFLILKAPKFVARVAFGEMSTLLIGGVAVSSQKVKETGFKFKYSSIEQAIKNLS